MKNPHIIVGEPRRCVCGSYNGEAIGCIQIIRVLKWLEEYAKAQLNPSLYIRKGETYPPQPPTATDIMLLVQVMKPLVKDCADSPN